MLPTPPRTSYWDASPQFRNIVRRALSDDAWQWALPQLETMGNRAALEAAPLAQIADKQSPQLINFNERGERIDRIVYHPAYRELQKIAYGSGMLTMKYTQHAHSADAPFISFALGYLFAMAEMGLYCPLCMTDGVARVVSRRGTSEQIERVIPRLSSTNIDELWTGGMFLTERAGGSDVGANETIARLDDPLSPVACRLTGQKWFCSSVDAEAVLATARPEGGEPGIRGIRTYLLLTRDNGVRIDRIKDKLGVRSMPTGEVTLDNAYAEEIGGFEAIAEMMNLSRLYNAVASVAVIGRAIHEARSYVEQRRAFGHRVADFPMVRQTLADLEAEHLGALLLTFEAVDALRRADNGDPEAARLLRILTPIAKAVTGKLAVPCVSECMELMGGNGYIEDWVMPRLLRDAQVLPIWEGTTNILALDMLRTAKKERGHEIMLGRIGSAVPSAVLRVEETIANADERTARRAMDALARAYEVALLREIGEDAMAQRLSARPLGLLPGA